jgi:ADP-dependent NAD(P)H-hydrate dehydratase
MSTTPELVTELPRLAPRTVDGHKGTYGHVLVISGGRGMSGAAVLCGSAALRGGAGLVTVATPTEIVSVVAAGNPCYMTRPLPTDTDGRLSADALPVILGDAEAADVVAVGPGLGQSAGVASVVVKLVGRLPRPLVLDADGLNNLSGNVDLLRTRPAPTVLTPHPGEFARLTGRTIADVQANREGLAAEFAAAYKVVLLLKGPTTIVTDGRRLSRNTTGNPGMATGGTGDVLTGLTAALLGQGLDAFDAARLAAHLHGLAGDLARDELGEVAMIATDVLGHLPAAFRRHHGR